MAIDPKELKRAIFHCSLVKILHGVRTPAVYGWRKRYHASSTFDGPFDRIVPIHVDDKFIPSLH